MEVFTIASWEIWKQRNARIFRNSTPSFQSWKDCFFTSVKQEAYRINSVDRELALSWLHSIS
ncbi:hypothetical protein PR202_gb13480 [Eleusine coracana subsp. coracana]|uniref:Uncharacterized protein n=1 Tax=Eleusine coracana subsp. coracana TaxID=191504 RepID=A0AAV5ETB3_ELECO|nr:hypothetical protein PR202_gb13480 [Eleusine coracana subsp. coracana]